MSEDGGSFVGFTSTTYAGQIPSGRAGAHAACAAEFAGSHLCHAAEYTLANSAVAPPSGGAWLDPSGDLEHSWSTWGTVRAGRSANETACISWSRNTAGYGGTGITEAGSITTSLDCSTTHPLACCNTPSKTRFAGFTTATTTGNAGGRHKMHALCAAEFAGAHLCHAAEYLRSNSATPVPTSGAWLDPSGFGKNSWSTIGLPEAGRSNNETACISWSRDTSGYGGTSLTASGSISTSLDCSTAHALTCCY